MLTWLLGERGALRFGRRGRPSRSEVYWCSPYCERTFKRYRDRAEHRARCLGYHRYATEGLERMMAAERDPDS